MSSPTFKRTHVAGSIWFASLETGPSAGSGSGGKQSSTDRAMLHGTMDVLRITAFPWEMVNKFSKSS